MAHCLNGAGSMNRISKFVMVFGLPLAAVLIACGTRDDAPSDSTSAPLAGEEFVDDCDEGEGGVTEDGGIAEEGGFETFDWADGIRPQGPPVRPPPKTCPPQRPPQCNWTGEKLVHND